MNVTLVYNQYLMKKELVGNISKAKTQQRPKHELTNPTDSGLCKGVKTQVQGKILPVTVLCHTNRRLHCTRRDDKRN